MKKNDVSSTFELFYMKGVADYNAAKILFDSIATSKLDVEPETILFHLQQAVEKFLKSILSKRSIRIRQTHDLLTLTELLDTNSIKISVELEPLLELTEFVVNGRYAIILDDLDLCEKLLPIVNELQLVTELYIKDQS